MKSRPSAAVTWAPAAFLKNIGSPPTPRKARTGELTPPGMYLQASSYRLNSFSRDVARTLNSEGVRRQAEPHFEAACPAVGRLGGPAMSLHDLSRDGQPNALAAGVAIAGLGDPIEGLEDALEVSIGNPGSAVANENRHT